VQSIFHLIGMVSAVLMIIFILAQARGSSLGEAFGGDNAIHRSRRGVELVVYQATVLFAVIFVVSIFLGLLSN
jgi:preprotein translocase subunit SecG